MGPEDLKISYHWGQGRLKWMEITMGDRGFLVEDQGIRYMIWCTGALASVGTAATAALAVAYIWDLLEGK